MGGKKRWVKLLAVLLMGLAPLLVIVLALAIGGGAAKAAGGPLVVEIGAAYNLVVDSNVGSPSTYAPSVATVIGRFCNTGTATLSNVWGHIGNYSETNPSASTPGIYPARNSAGADFVGNPLSNTGIYSFTHVGGRVGLNDASRYIGSLAPSECKVQYWHFTYPQCSEADRVAPCSGTPVWGNSVKPEDDLWLEFDIWATADGGYRNYATRKMTMRNEISAMANKIEPNGNPGGVWFNTNGDTVRPGDVITSNGVHYEFGLVRHGFDNDGDFDPDYNAWAQPIGDPSFDPSCFRLIRTTGVITVSRGAGKPDLIIPFTDQLYFMDLPPDNTGVVGDVYYTFLALDGPCSTNLTPYQEVASGYDNEKFNGDYGTGIPPIGGSEPQVTLDKSGNLVVVPGARITYTLAYSNAGDSAAGLPLASMPLVFSDSIPMSTTFTGDVQAAGFTILYSTDNGKTYSTTQPSPVSQVTNIQLWMSNTLAAHAGGVVTFSVQVASTPPITPFVENCADARFDGAPPFARDCFSTLISGTNRIGDWVWKDGDGDGVQDAGETGISSIALSLYWDRNGNGTLDSGDPPVLTTTTSITGWYTFNNLPNGNYLVQVDGSDPDLPYGYNHTTASLYSVQGLGTTTASPYLTADFGFGPVLRLDKRLVSADPGYEGDLVTYTVDLINTRPGNGTGQTLVCSYTVWAATEDTGHSGSGPSNSWINPSNAFGAGGPNGSYADSAWANASDVIAGTSFTMGNQGGNITSVEAIFSIYIVATDADTDGPIEDDYTDVALYYNDASITTTRFVTVYNSYEGLSRQGLLSWNVTNARSWAWTDFVGSFIDVQLSSGRVPAKDNADLFLDALGFRITTNQSCGGPNDTIATLPLTDTYDATRLQFVSAVPPQNSTYTTASPYTTTGVISWTNLGPLYAGQTKVVTLTFRALEPTNNTTTTVTNTVAARNSKYSNGRPVHDASDWVTNTVLPTGKIGDYVWRDQDGEGDQDETGAGIPGVVISLTANVTITLRDGRAYAPGSTVTTTTDANGLYLFEGLRYTGRYTVTVVTSTLPAAGLPYTNTYDFESPYNSRASFVLTPTLAGGGNQLGADFGYQLPAIIDGHIWHDWNRNGASAPDSGEEWLTAVTVTLYYAGSPVASTRTDANGYFRFVGDYAGTYSVTVATGTGDMSAGTWIQSFDTDGTGTAHQVTVTAALGGQTHADYSYYKTGTTAIGDTLYYDWDGDATQDANEEGIPNVTVTLYEDSNGNGVVDAGIDTLLSTTVTADGAGVYPAGYYTFTNRAAYSYTVVVDVADPDFPRQYYPTQDPDEDGAVCATCDSRGKAVTTGGSVSDIDFGYKPTGSGAIGDTVWRDMNGDGIQAGPQETGIVSIAVWLEADFSDGTYARIMTTTTSVTGTYLFSSLPDGKYRVVVDSSDSDLPTDAFRYSYIPSTPTTTGPITIASGSTYLDADFGFMPRGAIGDTIYWDANDDAEQDWNEDGIGGVVVTLTNVSSIVVGGISYNPGAYVLVATTNVSGTYLFTGLVSGTYSVTVGASAITGTLTGDPDTNGIPCTQIQPGNFFYPFCDSQTSARIRPGTIFLGADFGYQPSGVIGDFVWRDLDNDGIQDLGEPGIAGVVITVTDSVLYTTTTDLDGYYSFANLPNDTYIVAFQQPANMTPTVSSANAVTTGVGSAGLTATVVIAAGKVTFIDGADCITCSLHIDSGFVINGDLYISGTVFFDASGGPVTNDRFETGDTPYANITVYLWDQSRRLVGSTTTDASGHYTFSGLIGGGAVYTVSLNMDSPQLDGLRLTACYNYELANYHTVILSSSPLTDVDFGFYTAMDFGDLPAGYNITSLSDEGPRHISGTLRLGSGVSMEGDTRGENSAADADTLDDGVARDMLDYWRPGLTVNLVVTVTGGSGRLAGWFDWNNNGAFDDAGSFHDFGDISGAGQSLNLTLPSTYVTGTQVYARFRLFDPASLPGDSLDAYDYVGAATNGEVEDYRWLFGPTAVTLRRLAAHPASGAHAGAAMAGLLVLGIGWLALLWRKRRAA